MSIVLAMFFIVWVIAVVGLVLTPCSSTPRHRLQKEEMVQPAPTKSVCRFKCSNDGDNKEEHHDPRTDTPTARRVEFDASKDRHPIFDVPTD